LAVAIVFWQPMAHQGNDRFRERKQFEQRREGDDLVVLGIHHLLRATPSTVAPANPIALSFSFVSVWRR
jgi:hypothetical protein